MCSSYDRNGRNSPVLPPVSWRWASRGAVLEGLARPVQRIQEFPEVAGVTWSLGEPFQEPGEERFVILAGLGAFGAGAVFPPLKCTSWPSFVKMREGMP